MEIRSTGNPDTRNLATMSMLEYLRKKGIEAMGMTNGERIRDMADEELAEMLCNTVTFEKCGELYLSTCVDDEIEVQSDYGDILEWLKQPAEE